MEIKQIYFDRVRTALNEEDIPGATYKVTSECKPGDGYLGLHGMVEVNGRKEKLKLFVKIAPIDKKFREEVSIRRVYLNESLFYMKIYPNLINFQTERKSRHVLQSIPKCYGVVNANLKETIVLENLEEDNYRLYDRRNFLNKDHIEIVLKEYGHFHGVFFALKDQNKELYEELAQDIFTPFDHFIYEDHFQKAIRYFIDVAKQSLDPIEDKGVYNIFDRFTEEVIPFLKYVKALAKDKYAIITHGDGWCNNFMFKYNDPVNPTKPTSMRFLDFQLMRVGSPVFDVAYFFYCSCGKNEMDNLEHYLRFYYDNLASTIRTLGSDPEVLYPYAALQEEWKKYSRYAMIIGWIVLKNMLTEPDEAVLAAQKTDRVSESFMFEIREHKLYKERLRDVIVHFANNGFLELLNLT